MPGWKCKLCTSTSSSTKYRQKIGTGKGNSEVRRYLKDLGISKSIFPEDFICSACHMKVRQNSGLGKSTLVSIENSFFNFDTLEDENFDLLTGLTASQFKHLFNFCKLLLYSMQKKRHLAKFMMIITTTGYILEVAGPYGANSGNNDAGILAHMLSTTPRGSELLDFVDPEKNTFIVDRGFRDVEESAKEKGFQFFKPSFLAKNQKQFTASEANDSRLVTMVRWKVEAINGLFKNKFSFFDNVVSNNHLLTLPIDLRIACALINAYFPPLKVESPENIERVRLAIQAAQIQTNSLQKLVEELKLYRGKKDWEQRNKDTLEFPELSFDDLEKLTLGVFQKNMAKVYSFNHLKLDPDFTVDLHKTIPNLIRCKVQSKYSKNKKHYAFVQFELTKTGHESITRCYCKCNNGAREVGKCSHSTTLLFYFGLARHHPAVIPRKRDFCAGIIDAGRRLQDPESSSSESEQDDES